MDGSITTGMIFGPARLYVSLPDSARIGLTRGPGGDFKLQDLADNLFKLITGKVANAQEVISRPKLGCVEITCARNARDAVLDSLKMTLGVPDITPYVLDISHVVIIS